MIQRSGKFQLSPTLAQLVMTEHNIKRNMPFHNSNTNATLLPPIIYHKNKYFFSHLPFKMYGKFNDTFIWVVRKNKQHGKMFKYVYVRSVKELLKHISLAVNNLLENKAEIIIHLSVVGECPVVFLYSFWLCLRLF